MNPMKPKNEERPIQPGQSGPGTVDRVHDAANSLAEKAKDAASAMGDKAKDAASTVVRKAEDAASLVGHKADDATSAVGSGLKSLGSTIREHTPSTGALGDASAGVANTLDSAGRYLQDQGLKGIGEDVTNLIRRNPIPALLVGVGIGFLIARASTSRT